MDNSLISIILPVHNVELYLDRCINSLINQTYKNIEIIMINDGSTDNSGIICEKYAKIDNRIKVFHQENCGVAVARNRGIEKCNGEYIGFVDPDDFIDKKMYEHLYNNMIKENADISITSCYYYYNDNNIVNTKKENQYMVMNSEEAIIKMNSYVYYGVGLWDKLYKRELWEGISFPEVRTAEDWYVIYKLIGKADRIVYDSEPYYYYRQRAESLSNKKSINIDCILASKEALEFVKKQYPKAVDSSYTMFVTTNIGVYDKLILLNKERENKQLADSIWKDVKDVRNKLDYKILPKGKKIQVLLFINSRALYKFIFKIANKLKKRVK